MLKQASIALFLSLSLVAGLSSSINDYLGYNRHACSNGTDVFNKVLSRFQQNVEEQVDQWMVYSDLEVLNGLSYELVHTCNASDVELVSRQGAGQTDAEQEACDNLLNLLSSILEQNGGGSFSAGDYEGNVRASEQVLALGSELGDSCYIKLVYSGDEDEASNFAGSEEEDLQEIGEDQTSQGTGRMLQSKFYTVNINGDTDSGSQWKNGDYTRYYDGSTLKDGGQWSKGGYQRYYDGGQGLIDEEKLEAEAAVEAEAEIKAEAEAETQTEDETGVEVENNSRS